MDTVTEKSEEILRIEEAIGELATLVSRSAKIPYNSYPSLRDITAEYQARYQARETEKDARLLALDKERKALLSAA